MYVWVAFDIFYRFRSYKFWEIEKKRERHDFSGKVEIPEKLLEDMENLFANRREDLLIATGRKGSMAICQLHREIDGKRAKISVQYLKAREGFLNTLRNGDDANDAKISSKIGAPDFRFAKYV